MTDSRNPFNHPLNPDYGKGVFRRKIGLNNLAGRVEAALEDCNHGFCVTVEHDGHVVTALAPVARRIPLTTCAGAAEPLAALVGVPLGLSARDLARRVDAASNCTHWLDLALLAIAQAVRDEPRREYVVNVPDAVNHGPVAAQVICNGRLVHEWSIADWAVTAPAALCGKPLYKGFIRWANDYFDDDDQREAALVLQKGYFVASARLFDIASLKGDPALGHTVMHGSCYSYSEPQLRTAVRVGAGSLRDFTDTPEQLLHFL